MYRAMAILLAIFVLGGAAACSAAPGAEHTPTAGRASTAAAPRRTTAPRPALTARDILRATAPPCFGELVNACRVASPELVAAYSDPHACDGAAPRVCILPIGNLPGAQIERLRDYFRTTYGLEVAVLPPIDATDGLGGQVNADEWKLEGSKIHDAVWASSYGQVLATGGKLLIISPVDLHAEADDADSFVFGQKWTSTETGEELFSIQSTFRMNPQTFGEPANDDIWFSRIRKLATKYVGMGYYGFTEDMDPASAMYRALYSVSALDGIKNDLPVAFGQPAATSKLLQIPVSPDVAAGAKCASFADAPCRQPAADQMAPARNVQGCDAPGRILCVVAVGNVPGWQVDAVIADLRDRQSAQVGVLPALPLANPPSHGANGSVSVYDASSPIDSVYASLDARKELSYIILTPFDVTRPNSTYFAFFGHAIDDKSREERYAIIPTFRLNPQSFGQPADDALWLTRILKLTARGAGLTYFSSPESPDPQSPLYSGLNSLADIDAMRETLK